MSLILSTRDGQKQGVMRFARGCIPEPLQYHDKYGQDKGVFVPGTKLCAWPGTRDLRVRHNFYVRLSPPPPLGSRYMALYAAGLSVADATSSLTFEYIKFQSFKIPDTRDFKLILTSAPDRAPGLGFGDILGCHRARYEKSLQ